MFWSKKKKKVSKKKKAAKNPKALSSEELRAQAMENVRHAREQIGEETLDRIAAAMTKKQRSATEQAKTAIQQSDADRVADEILFMMDPQS